MLFLIEIDLTIMLVFCVEYLFDVFEFKFCVLLSLYLTTDYGVKKWECFW